MSAKRPLEDWEVQRMLSMGFIGRKAKRNRALFAFGITTGYRIGEILSCRISDVWDTQTVREYAELPPSRRKKNAPGITKKILPFARQALREYIVQRRNTLEDTSNFPDAWLFLSDHPDQRTGQEKPLGLPAVHHLLKNAFERCGIHDAVASHSMRKTFAKKIYKQALEDFKAGRIDVNPLRIVQKHLGHVSINSTEAYLSFITLDIDETNFDFNIGKHSDDFDINEARQALTQLIEKLEILNENGAINEFTEEENDLIQQLELLIH